MQCNEMQWNEAECGGMQWNGNKMAFHKSLKERLDKKNEAPFSNFLSQFFHQHSLPFYCNEDNDKFENIECAPLFQVRALKN